MVVADVVAADTVTLCGRYGRTPFDGYTASPTVCKCSQWMVLVHNVL